MDAAFLVGCLIGVLLALLSVARHCMRRPDGMTRKPRMR
jgi:hypothetical protein